VQARFPGPFSQAKNMSGKIQTVGTGPRAHGAATLELRAVASGMGTLDA